MNLQKILKNFVQRLHASDCLSRFSGLFDFVPSDLAYQIQAFFGAERQETRVVKEECGQMVRELIDAVELDLEKLKYANA